MFLSVFVFKYIASYFANSECHQGYTHIVDSVRVYWNYILLSNKRIKSTSFYPVGYTNMPYCFWQPISVVRVFIFVLFFLCLYSCLITYNLFFKLFVHLFTFWPIPHVISAIIYCVQLLNGLCLLSICVHAHAVRLHPNVTCRASTRRAILLGSCGRTFSLRQGNEVFAVSA